MVQIYDCEGFALETQPDVFIMICLKKSLRKPRITLWELMMKSAKDILLEMGFKKGGSASTKEAFIKNLVKHANQNSGPRSKPVSQNSVSEQKNNEPLQLSFDFDDQPDNKKLVG